MNNKVCIATLVIALLILIMPGTAFADIQNNQLYAFELQSQADKQMSVQFVGNQMYHNGRYMGYGISGKPMLTLRYLAEWFGFQVDYNAQNRTTLVSNGEYSFQIESNSNIAEIYWGGEKVKEYELTEKPFIQKSRLHIYSLDISDLLGLMNNWDNNTRTWDVLYRDYTYQELGFPTVVNDDVLTIKGLLFAHGQYEMPVLEIRDTINNVHSYIGSVCSKDFEANSKPKYEISSTIKMQEENNQLQVSLTMGQRILFVKNIAVVVNLADKELVVKQPSYQFTSPTKGYIKVDKPEITISGSVAGINNYYPSEIVLLAKKVDNTEIRLQESIPVIDGQFMSKLALENEEGLYKVTVNSVMAAPRGPAYVEITNFYVEYREGEQVDYTSTLSEPVKDTGSTNTSGDNEQKQEPSEVQFTFYPSGPDFIKSVINERGNVEITGDMRKKFNLFARDYHWCYMPDMDGYESFFEANKYAKSFGYNNFGFAVFYVLHYMKCPEKMSDDAMQSAIQSLFVAKDSYKDMPHQVYLRLANYEDGYYSLWPEGMPDHNRKFYLLTKLDIVPHETDGVYITVLTKEYYFHDSLYEPGENEKWLAEKAKELGIPDMQAAAKLLANGEMEELKNGSEFETTIYINIADQNSHGLSPRFISSRSRDIAVAD